MSFKDSTDPKAWWQYNEYKIILQWLSENKADFRKTTTVLNNVSVKGILKYFNEDFTL
jgi:hypothetical protein